MVGPIQRRQSRLVDDRQRGAGAEGDGCGQQPEDLRARQQRVRQLHGGELLATSAADAYAKPKTTAPRLYTGSLLADGRCCRQRRYR
eukprot:2398628-Prymnesium_polylepis.1